MDKYGLTEHEKETHLHDYNHALFNNMMFFLDIEWEINILTRTVVVLADKNEPERNGKEFDYEDVFGDYLHRYVAEADRDICFTHLRFEKLLELEKEVSFDIHLQVHESACELYNIVLTPAFDEEQGLYCVYMGARNLQAEILRGLEEYRRQEKFLKALVADSDCYLSFDLTGDCMIRGDFEGKNGRRMVSEMTGTDQPISYEEYIHTWFDKYSPQFEKEEDKELFEIASLKKLYENGEQMVELEIKQDDPQGKNPASIIQVFIILMAKPEDKHVWVYILLKDISKFQRKTMQDNMELINSNETLRNSLSQEQQYRMASLSGALLVYDINLTKNLIEEEFYEIVDDKRIPMLELVGLKPPCDFDEFCKRWCETKVSAESRETFLNMFNREFMLEEYKKGERYLEIEFDTVLGRGIRVTLRNTAFLVEDQTTGDIIAMVNSKDISKQREEEKRQRETLRDAYEAASNANTVKTDFLTRMSHDIRTPMNAIVGMTAIASKHLDNEKRVADCLKEISNAGKYLLVILTEVLDMSKIEAGKLELVEKEFNLAALMDNIATIGGLQSREKEHNFTVSVGDLPHERVLGDSQRLQQALMYLIDNAFKYTAEGGRIKMTVTERKTDSPAEGSYEFVLEDNGIGMDEEYLLQVFDPFVRAEDRRVSKIQGTGLGLPIAKSIVQMMNGDIKIESEPNRGTKITVDVCLKLPEKGE